MASADSTKPGPIAALGDTALSILTLIGDFAVFAGRTFHWAVRRRPAPRTIWPSFYTVGVSSVPVVAVTGMFIGMVLAVQAFSQFRSMGLATRLGSLINISIVSELGPVLAATMLAGRVGSAMAAELGTMRVTEQVDALAVLGAHPLHYLVVPRLLACALLIPLLTIMADYMGIMGGALIRTRVYGVESHHYWEHSREFVRLSDIGIGLVKAFCFGIAIALIGCHRGLNSQPGAEGVGRAATEAFVASFVAILVIDFFLSIWIVRLLELFIPGSTIRSMM